MNITSKLLAGIALVVMPAMAQAAVCTFVSEKNFSADVVAAQVAQYKPATVGEYINVLNKNILSVSDKDTLMANIHRQCLQEIQLGAFQVNNLKASDPISVLRGRAFYLPTRTTLNGVPAVAPVVASPPNNLRPGETIDQQIADLALKIANTDARLAAGNPSGAPGPVVQDLTPAIDRLERRIASLESRPAATLSAGERKLLQDDRANLVQAKAAQKAAEDARDAAKQSAEAAATSATSASGSAGEAKSAAEQTAADRVAVGIDANLARAAAILAQQNASMWTPSWLSWFPLGIPGLGLFIAVLAIIGVIAIVLWWKKFVEKRIRAIEKRVGTVDGHLTDLSDQVGGRLMMQLPPHLEEDLTAMEIGNTTERTFEVEPLSKCDAKTFTLRFTKLKGEQVTVEGIHLQTQPMNINGIVSKLKGHFRRCREEGDPLGVKLTAAA